MLQAPLDLTHVRLHLSHLTYYITSKRSHVGVMDPVLHLVNQKHS